MKCFRSRHCTEKQTLSSLGRGRLLSLKNKGWIGCDICHVFIYLHLGGCTYLHGTRKTSDVEVFRWMCRGPVWPVVSPSYDKKIPSVTVVISDSKKSFICSLPGTWTMETRAGRKRHFSVWRTWKRKMGESERGVGVRNVEADQRKNTLWPLFLGTARRAGRILRLL